MVLPPLCSGLQVKLSCIVRERALLLAAGRGLGESEKRAECVLQARPTTESRQDTLQAIGGGRRLAQRNEANLPSVDNRVTHADTHWPAALQLVCHLLYVDELHVALLPADKRPLTGLQANGERTQQI